MLDKIASLESGRKALQESLDEETRKRKAAERKAQRLDEQLKYVNANCFGDNRQKVKKDKGSHENKPDKLELPRNF